MNAIVVGAALTLSVPPALSAQQTPPRPSAAPAQYNVIPPNRLRPGANLPPIRGTPWISEQQSPAGAERGPRLPEQVQPAVSKLYADDAPAPAGDVIIIPVTTILIVLLVVLIIVAAD
jgi:hypothetical protein